MILNEGGKEYLVREYSVKKRAGDIALEWRAAKGTHFFVVVYDCRSQLDLKGLIENITDRMGSDEAIVQKNGNKLYVDEKAGIKVFCYKQREFLSGGQCCLFPINEMNPSVPYALSVYVGEYDSENKVMYVFDPVSPDNTEYMPVSVKAQVKYSNKLLSNQKVCKLLVPYVEKYVDGAITYHVDGVHWDFPIPASAIGKVLTITVPKDSDVSIRIAEDYKKYYKKA